MKVPANVNQLPLDKFILPQALKAAGYATGMFGKWHLGNAGDYHPSRRGFDEALVSDNKHFNFTTIPPADYPAGQYFADFVTDRAVDFIGRHRDRPFFLYVPHFAVHTPIQAKPDYIAAWEKKRPQGTHWNPTYAAMIQSVDESVGRIVARLEELKLTDNTIIIFSSDNGGLGGYQSTEAPSEKKGFTDNSPLRGGKGTLYEGGTRVPFIVRWPGVVPAGRTSDVPVAHVDVYPTLLDLVGGTPRAGYTLDGVSFAPCCATRRPRFHARRSTGISPATSNPMSTRAVGAPRPSARFTPASLSCSNFSRPAPSNSTTFATTSVRAATSPPRPPPKSRSCAPSWPHGAPKSAPPCPQ